MIQFWIFDFGFSIRRLTVRKVFGFALCAILFAFCASVEAQQPEKIPRIGFVQRRVAPTAAKPDPLGEAFLQGLRNLGYIEGKNIQVERRFAEGIADRLPGLVAELVQLKVDVLVIPGFAAIRAPSKRPKRSPLS